MKSTSAPFSKCSVPLKAMCSRKWAKTELVVVFDDRPDPDDESQLRTVFGLLVLADEVTEAVGELTNRQQSGSTGIS